MTQGIDSRIKQAQRKGVGVYLLSGTITLVVVLGVLLWLFFIKGYSIVIGPSEASQNRKVELLSGMAWVSETNIYTLGGDISISVSADTFETTTLTITKQSPSTIEVVLLPSPATISAQVSVVTQEGLDANDLEKQQVYLQQSQWFMNGKLVQVGENFSHQTAPGEYLLEVANPYYQSVSIPLSLSRAEEVELTPTLDIINGTISLNSVPAGANVSINGELLGKTPIEIDLSGGDYEVQVTSDAFQTIDETISLQSGFLRPSRNYQLIPKQAELVVTASPSDGVLLINNLEHKLGRIALAANKAHKIEYRKAGHSTFVQTMNLQRGQATPLNIELTPLYGELSITANVPASLSINGSTQGKAPLNKSLLSVPYTIEAQLQGYRSITKRVTPVPNKTTPVVFNLLTEYEARRQEGRPLVISQLGIDMLRFRGNAFTMGSPPNETGRRRNEHQINIEFERQFWISTKEITQAQFGAFKSGQNINAKLSGGSNLPVTGVSWLEAAQFCNWLSIQEGLPVFYRFVNGRYAGVNQNSLGYRLPTEAEWEWVAKKSNRSLSTVYVWGNQTKLRDNQGNFADQSIKGEQLIVLEDYKDGQKELAAVGSYKADRSGLFDLDGNASEWVHDFYTTNLPDTSKTHIDYLGASSGEAWVVKGGNYQTGRLRELRAAFREFSSEAKPNVGFRIARYHN